MEENENTDRTAASSLVKDEAAKEVEIASGSREEPSPSPRNAATTPKRAADHPAPVSQGVVNEGGDSTGEPRSAGVVQNKDSAEVGAVASMGGVLGASRTLVLLGSVNEGRPDYSALLLYCCSLRDMTPSFSSPFAPLASAGRLLAVTSTVSLVWSLR